MSLRYGSVCSGVDPAGKQLAAELGWRCQWHAEIEAFPSAVLAHHYPEVPNLGDFTAIGPQHGSIDLLMGGTPCQSFSVAGKRGGLDDARGNLALEFCQLARRMGARWVLWENVPGVLSSNGGKDFGAFLGALANCGYGFAYRILDAQNFGVPQRRRRVFVVGYTGDWRPPAAVLQEPEMLHRHSAPGRKAGEDVTGTLGSCSKDGGIRTTDLDGSGAFIVHTLRGEGFDASEDGTGRGTPLIPIDMRQASRGERMTNNRNPEKAGGGAPGTGIGEAGDPAPTLSESHPPAILSPQLGVRSLSPRECERLQGFADDWTLVPYRGKPAADGPRYKAIGNSWAVPVILWICRRIQAVEVAL